MARARGVSPPSRGTGGLGLAVERPEDIRPALEAAFASGRTVCVNVMVDPAVISPGSVALANLGGYCAGK